MASGKNNKYDDFDFSDFEPKRTSYERNAARKIDTAPKRRQAEKKPDMKLVKRPKKSYARTREEMKRANLHTAKIIAISLVLLVMMSALLYGRMKADELDRQIQSKKNELSVAQSENVRLSMKLDSMISLKNVEDYAQNNLGMVKMESHQIEYIDLSGEDKAVVSGNKSKKSESKNKASFISRLKEYMSK